MNFINFNDLCKLKRTHLIRLNPLDSIQSVIASNYHNNLLDPYIAVIEEHNAMVNDNLFVKTNDGYIIQDIGYRERIPLNFNHVATEEIKDTAFLLGGDTNYYHWLINWLPRLFLYESLNLKCKIIVNKNFSRTQLNVIKSVFPWFDGSNIIVNKNSYLYKSLYIPNFFLNPIHSPIFISKLRQRIYSLYYNELDTKKFSDKLYISRSDAKFRKIINENDLFCCIKNHWGGGQKITLGELSFLDQINAFYHAKIIVSPHGAGLANLIFCNHQPQVVEIINDFYTKVFWSLGFLCGCKTYNVFKGNSIPDINLKAQQYNIIVNIEKFINEQKNNF